VPPAVDLAVGVLLRAAGRNRDESRPELSIDKHFLESLFYGVRQMTWHLQNEGHAMNQKPIQRLMRLMPIYQKPNTSTPAKGHKTYPYLLDGLRIYRPSKFRCADITYSPMRKGLLCLVAIMDWFTRKVLARRNSSSPEADFCLEAQIEAIHKFGQPEIMNADQGSQFTSVYWTDRLKRAKTKISTDGKARYLDNIFIERLWRPLKYECAYLHAWGTEAKAGVGRWITFYNHLRPRAVHGEQPPDVVNFNATQDDQQVQVVA
jgi:putative transposase